MIKITKKLVFLTDSMPVQLQDNTFYGDQYYLEHTHDYFEIFIILEGVMRHRLNDEIQNLPPGTLCLIRPEDKHSVSSAVSAEELHIINIVFNEEIFNQSVLFINQEFKLECDDKDFFQPLKLNQQERLLFENKIDILKNAAFPGLKIALFKSFLQDVLLLISQRNFSARRAVPEWLRKARDKMRKKENFLRDLEYFVEISGKTQEHLTRTMKRYYKETPQAYLIHLRIEEAARLLRNTQFSLEEIMYKTAFQNMSYFRRCFKRYYGDPPKRYLKKSQQIFVPR